MEISVVNLSKFGISIRFARDMHLEEDRKPSWPKTNNRQSLNHQKKAKAHMKKFI